MKTLFASWNMQSNITTNKLFPHRHSYASSASVPSVLVRGFLREYENRIS
jgi:hypothetical protein